MDLINNEILKITNLILYSILSILSIWVILTHYFGSIKKTLEHKNNKKILEVIENADSKGWDYEINKNFKKFINIFLSKIENSDLFERNTIINYSLNSILMDTIVKKINEPNKLDKKFKILIHAYGSIKEYSLTNNIEDEKIIEKIKLILESKDDELAFEACLALLKIDTDKFSRDAVKQLIKRKNWRKFEYQQFVGYFNTSKSNQMLTKMLIATAGTKYEDKTINILREITNFSKYSTYIINNSNKFNLDSIIYALETLNSINNEKYILKIIKEYGLVDHVKEQVAKSTKRLNSYNEDIIKYLKINILDKNWWVRTQSAESVVRFYKNNESEIMELMNNLKDNYAKDALQYALEESKINND